MQYIINDNTLFLEKNDNLDQIFICEKKKKIYVNNSLKNIIDESCLKYGSNYKGRKEFSKNILKNSAKVPIIIREEPILIMFPINNIWINYNNIVSYQQVINLTEVVFFNNVRKTVNCSYYSFHNQYLKCCYLYTIFSRKNYEFSFK